MKKLILSATFLMCFNGLFSQQVVPLPVTDFSTFAVTNVDALIDQHSYYQDYGYTGYTKFQFGTNPDNLQFLSFFNDVDSVNFDPAQGGSYFAQFSTLQTPWFDTVIPTARYYFRAIVHITAPFDTIVYEPLRDTILVDPSVGIYETTERDDQNILEVLGNQMQINAPGYLQVFMTTGQLVSSQFVESGMISNYDLPRGMYVAVFRDKQTQKVITRKFVN